MYFGVSPAWFLSLYGETFSLLQAGESLALLADLGFTSWQPEIFLEEGLDEWVSGKAEDLRKRGLDLGLKTDIFVAHILGEGFSNRSGLESNDWTTMLTAILDSLESWTEINTVVVPLPSFHYESSNDSNSKRNIMETFISKLGEFAAIIESSGRKLALEVMPGSLAGKGTQIVSLFGQAGIEKVGINFDTGHFNAAGESQKNVLMLLGSRIVATHLCDNDGIANLSLPPGDGNVLWEDVIDGLYHARYNGSYDIEIRCPAEAVESAYKSGRDHLNRYLLKESA